MLFNYKYPEPQAPQIYPSLYWTLKAEQPQDVLAVLVADWFCLTIQCSGSRLNLKCRKPETLHRRAAFSQNPSLIFGIVFPFDISATAWLLWVPVLQGIGGVSRLRFRDRKGRETLGGEAVLRVLVGSNLGATMKWQKADCWSLPAARESRQALAHSKSRYRLLPARGQHRAETAPERRHATPNQSSSASGCLTGALKVSWMPFFEFCTVAINSESGPQQTWAPFRAIHTPHHFEHWSNGPCRASHAFKEEIHSCGHTIFLRCSQVFK